MSLELDNHERGFRRKLADFRLSPLKINFDLKLQLFTAVTITIRMGLIGFASKAEHHLEQTDGIKKWKSFHFRNCENVFIHSHLQTAG